eukprot:857510-Pyramimonas_sp.AAC.1
MPSASSSGATRRLRSGTSSLAGPTTCRAPSPLSSSINYAGRCPSWSWTCGSQAAGRPALITYGF